MKRTTPKTQLSDRPEISLPPEGVVLNEVADLARYQGSPEHKRDPSAGPPNPKPNNSICPGEFGKVDESGAKWSTLTRWLREAIGEGVCGFWETALLPGQAGKAIVPRYVWCRVEPGAWCVFRHTGQAIYKGYPEDRPLQIPEKLR